MKTYGKHAWVLLGSAERWAEAKVKAIASKSSAVVLALVSDQEELANAKKHVFCFDDFLKFVKHPTRTSLGLSKF